MKNTIRNLSKKDDLYRVITETVPDMITVWDMRLRLIYANPSVEHLLGYTEAELMSVFDNTGRSGLERIIAPGSLDAFLAETGQWMKECLQRSDAERNVPAEIEMIRKDGSTVWTEIKTSFLTDGNGQQSGFIAIARDISKRKENREVLEKSEERYRNILESIEEGYFELDLAGNFTFFNDALCRMTGYSPAELLGMSNRRYTSPETAQQLSETFRQIHAGGNPAQMNGYEVIRKNGGIRIHDMSASLILDASGNPVGFRGVARDVTEHEQRERQLKESYDNLQHMLEETVRTLAFTVEIRDPYTAGHQRRVAQLADAISREMKLPEVEAIGIRMAALIHDVGKVQIPGEILNKPGPLSINEMDLIKTHPEVGSSILKEIQFPWPIAEIILQHHGRLDGSGYPKGIDEEKMCIGAKILAVADVVEAMVSHRPYRSAMGFDKAIEEISNNKGTLYDSAVVDVCLSLLTEGTFQFE